MPPPANNLPVQVPVDEPILNRPYEVPEWHWVYGSDGVANKMPGRRPAAYFWSGRQAGDRQGGLEGIEADVGSERLTLVNALRQDVAKWRASGYENATVTTKKLLQHWHGGRPSSGYQSPHLLHLLLHLLLQHPSHLRQRDPRQGGPWMPGPYPAS